MNKWMNEFILQFKYINIMVCDIIPYMVKI
jgi:hypothetical protein